LTLAQGQELSRAQLANLPIINTLDQVFAKVTSGENIVSEFDEAQRTSEFSC
jgi:hypothetical protein